MGQMGQTLQLGWKIPWKTACQLWWQRCDGQRKGSKGSKGRKGRKGRTWKGIFRKGKGRKGKGKGRKGSQIAIDWLGAGARPRAEASNGESLSWGWSFTSLRSYSFTKKDAQPKSQEEASHGIHMLFKEMTLNGDNDLNSWNLEDVESNQLVLWCPAHSRSLRWQMALRTTRISCRSFRRTCLLDKEGWYTLALIFFWSIIAGLSFWILAVLDSA